MKKRRFLMLGLVLIVGIAMTFCLAGCGSAKSSGAGVGRGLNIASTVVTTEYNPANIKHV